MVRAIRLVPKAEYSSLFFQPILKINVEHPISWL